MLAGVGVAAGINVPAAEANLCVRAGGVSRRWRKGSHDMTTAKQIVDRRRGWFREALSDERGQADIAYASVGVLTIAAICSIAYLFAMGAIDYWNCAPTTTLTKGGEDLTSVVPCRFDPLPMGQAVGLIFAAYASLIASLAGYMAATRRRVITTPNGETVTTEGR
jgi:hypothetical protein